MDGGSERKLRGEICEKQQCDSGREGRSRGEAQKREGLKRNFDSAGMQERDQERWDERKIECEIEKEKERLWCREGRRKRE